MPRCAIEQDTGKGLGWTAPDPFEVDLSTERLRIRAWRLEDAPSLYEAVNASRTHLLPWMPWAEGHRDPADTMLYVTQQVLAARAPGALTALGVGIFDRESGRVLGGTGFHGAHRDTATAEIGYWLRADATGRGYATEAAARVLSWCLAPQSAGGLGLARVVVYCSEANAASRRVAERLGLPEEVRQRRDYFVSGHGCTDRLGWGVLAEEWDVRTHAMKEPTT
jgi:RimJ/RimL family protein N-acetyltransferase